MKIKRLEIIGFKSFLDKASLDFQHGITAVVGPNGCGKSNIVDAIRWAMGEQSAKTLRGKQMEDIIFGGSESRKPLGMAEVSLVFSAEDGKVPAKYLNFSEIQITRRLYRDGESEYLINKTPCRLMDISELFMDTGVGAKAYSVIEQGRIGMILLAKPEERRFLIEEAAGVTKFKVRKQVALKKIEVTRQNLIRLGDIISEIKRQLGSLQRQAKKAEKFREYREELRHLELALAVQELLALDQGIMVTEAALVNLVAEAERLSGDLDRGGLDLEEKKITLLEKEKGVAAAQEDVYQVKNDTQNFENKLEFQKKEQVNLERHFARFNEELESIQRQTIEAEAELKLLDDRKTGFTAELAAEEDSLALREEEVSCLAAAELAAASELEAVRKELFTIHSEISQSSNQRAVTQKRSAAVEEKLLKRGKEAETLLGRKAETDSQIQLLEASLHAILAEKEEGAVSLTRLKHDEEQLTEMCQELEVMLRSKRDALTSASSRHKSLRELEAQFAGYGKGVKAVLSSEQFSSRFSGVLADLVEAPEEYEGAVEAVLSDRLQYLVALGEGPALEAIAFLKESVGGRCSFLVAPPAMPVGKLPRDIPSLGDFVTIRDGYVALLAPYLSTCFIVNDLFAAITASRQFPGAVFVTREGDIVGADGALTGGSREGLDEGLIHKKREIRELAVLVQTLTHEVVGHEQSLEKLKKSIADKAEAVKAAGYALHQLELNIVNHEKDLIRLREDGIRIDEMRALQQMEDEQLAEELEVLTADMESTAATLAGLEVRKVSAESSAEHMQKTLENKKRELELAREFLTTVKVRTAALKEKQESNLRASKRVEGLAEDLRKRAANHRKELEKTVVDREELAGMITAAELTLKELVGRQIAADGILKEGKDAYDQALAALQSTENALKVLRAKYDKAQHESAMHNVSVTELKLKREHIAGTILDRYRIELDDALLRYRDSEFDPVTAVQRQDVLKSAIEELGEVNLAALEDYRQLDERHNFLATQKSDLEESLHSLNQAIVKINRTTRKRFLETFTLVNEKFREVFPRLFCGGTAELRLTNEADLLETGIDIIVQPPGKKLQNVTLLSGGEKALTAVALIFSIFMVKPSPFCLLDEVDAPLDDANIGRFNEMVREMSSFSQFIMITHSKTTMTVADTLYGITMEEPGVSKVVSVRFN